MARRRHRRSERGQGPLADGTITLRNPKGDVLHTSPASISSTLRTTITRLRLAGALPKTIGIASSIRGEGTTFVSRSFALVLAHDISSIRGEGAAYVGRSRALVLAHDAGERVCLVDLNWSAPTHSIAEMGDGHGIADVLRGEVALDDVIMTVEDPFLSIVPAGNADANEIAVFSSSAALTVLIEDLARRFAHIIVDLPAVRSASESLALAARTDGLLLVVRAGVTTEAQVKSTLEQLSGMPVLGVILNDFRTKVPAAIQRRLAMH